MKKRDNKQAAGAEERPASAGCAVPFCVNRSLRVDVSTQVTDGLRLAIQSGFYAPGEMVPTVRDFARALGVSIRAPQAAFRALAREGLLMPRRHVGTFVAAGVADVFHGRVVVVNPDLNPVYFNTFIEKSLCDRLMEAGYLPAQVAVHTLRRPARGPKRRRDEAAQLRMALQQKTSLATIVGTLPDELERMVARMGVPFAEVGTERPDTPLCVAFARITLDPALPAVTARLRERKAKRIVQIAPREAELLDGKALRAACGGVENLIIHESLDRGLAQQDIVRETMELFSRRWRRKADLPDAFLFADDYLARGALLALLSAGIHTGRDVLFITLANDGIIPVHPDPVDYILRDLPSDADAVAGTILRYLETGKPQETIQLQPRYIAAD